VVDEKSRLVAFDDLRGEQSWQNGQFLNRELSGPHIHAGYLVVVDKLGYLHVISQVDGEVVGRLAIGGQGVRAPMQDVNDMLYLYTNNGHLIAFNIRRKT